MELWIQHGLVALLEIKQAIKNDLRGDLQKLDRLETLESEMAVMKGDIALIKGMLEQILGK